MARKYLYSVGEENARNASNYKIEKERERKEEGPCRTCRFEITLSLGGSYYDQGKLHAARAGDLFTERRGLKPRAG